MRRTFGCLRPYLGRLIISSVSAAIHALLAGLFVWLAGPLLMTLFQTGDITTVSNRTEPIVNVQSSPSSPSDKSSGVVNDLEKKLDFLARTKNSLKEKLNEHVSGDDRRGTLVNFCILIIIITIASNFFLYIQGFFMAYIQQSVIRDFRNRLFEKYQSLSLSYFHKQRTGQLVSRVTNDVIVLNETVDLGFNRLVIDSLTVVILTAFLVLLSWKLTLLAALVLPLVFGFIYWMGRKLRRYSARSQEKMADVNSVLEETVSNIRIVKAYAMEQFEIRKFFKATSDYFRALVRMTRIRHLASPVNDILIVAAGILILLYAGSRIINGGGEMDAGDFMTFVIAMFSLIKPVKNLFQIHIKLQEGMAAAERIFEVVDTPIQVQEKPGAIVKTRFESVIKYENVSFAYQSGSPVISNIDLEVGKGGVVALVGPSGAGKSTLFDLLPRFYDPTEGRITIDGVDIRDLTLNSLRGMLGIVTQETYLFNDSIQNNIAYGLEDVTSEQIIEAARAANAHDFISEFKHRYETQVGNRGVRLSGGQRQRIAIARALLKNPQILIFDEATSALDTESELLVQEAIERLMQDRTTLVIAHRLSTIVNADRIVVIERGRIIERGRHEDLIRKSGLYHRLYMMQFKNGQEETGSPGPITAG
nr:ABC transporter ATP-binding protein [candidate division Zixibacteria bacterium]